MVLKSISLALTHLCTIFLLISTTAYTFNITVYTKPYFQGVPTTIPIPKCVSLPPLIKNNISSINSQGNCVNLYKSDNCEGEYIVIDIGTPMHYDLFHWKGFDNAVNSIAPCYDHCDAKAVETPKPNTSYFVTVFDEKLYHGAHLTFDLQNSCVLIPLHLKRRISSIKTLGKFCIELHHNWDCKGFYAQLRPGSPKHQDLVHWVGHDDKTSALSLCGFGCGSYTWTNVTSSNTTPNLPGQVTIYDENSFHGNYKQVNISQKCHNLNNEWDGQMESLKLNNDSSSSSNCIILYDEFNCSTIHGRNVTIKMSQNATSTGFENLSNKNFSRVVQSFQLCSLPENETISALHKQKEGWSTFNVLFTIVMFLAFVSISSVGVAFSVKRYCKRDGEFHALIL